MKNIIIALCSLSLLIGCGEKSASTSAMAAQQSVATTSTPAMPAEDTPAAPQTISGKVLETMDAGGYTYIKLESASGAEWAAVSAATVKVGDSVTLLPQVTLENFESKSLNRTFERIIFGSVAAPGGASVMPSGHPSVPGAMKGMADIDPGTIDVPKADGADGKRVAEVWASRSSLGEKKVAIRGKVVKFSPAIMGKNWMHIRDGSGSREKGDDDITVTTKDTAAVGDVVLVNGIVRVDKDFGAGYSYAVIVEEAKIAK